MVDRLEKITGARLPLFWATSAWRAGSALRWQSGRAGQGNSPASGSSLTPWRVYNIRNNQPVELMDYIAVLKKALGKTTEIQLLPLNAGDVPNTKVEEGIQRFVAWYRNEFKFI